MLSRQAISDAVTHKIPIFAVDECASTNLLAREYAKEHGGSALFVAASQTAGRGRLGRSFLSPKGGLYFSLLLPEEPSALPLTVKVAVICAEILERLSGGRVQIKWVNDLYMESHKVAGILTEGITASDARFCVVGIGVNLAKADFPDLPLAGSVAEFAPRVPDVNELAAALTDGILSGISDGEALAAYKARSFLDGRRVQVLKPTETREADVIGITDTCALSVRYGSGEVEDLISGDVRIVPKP